jgi:hypothetical protein
MTRQRKGLFSRKLTLKMQSSEATFRKYSKYSKYRVRPEWHLVKPKTMVIPALSRDPVEGESR